MRHKRDMQRGIGATGFVIAELIRAALVIALLALSFTHSAPLAQAADSTALTHVAISTDLCGGSTDSVPGAHAPCHACRIVWAIDLPAMPSTVVPCIFSSEPVTFGTLSKVPVARFEGHPPRSRAPPALG
jgi:hypothetical protein